MSDSIKDFERKRIDILNKMVCFLRERGGCGCYIATFIDELDDLDEAMSKIPPKIDIDSGSVDGVD